MKSLINGEPSTVIPADDRGLLFGESIFETIAFHNNRAVLWEGHMARLRRGAEAFGWDTPAEEVLVAECSRLLLASCVDKAIIRITLTGGSGGSGYWPDPAPINRRIVQLRLWTTQLELQQKRGLRCIVSPFRLPAPWAFSGLKHGNRLLQTRAASHCRLHGADETLLLDRYERLAEALSSNLILVVDGQLMTPPDVEVEGVGLAWLKQTLGSELKVGTLAVRDIAKLEELLVINSVGGIRPVIAIQEQPLPVGPMARRLQTIWHEDLLLCD